MAASLKTVALTFSEAERLAELEGIRRDLQWTTRVCEALSEAWQEGADPLLLEALTTAALVRYSRCFKTGVRRRLPPEWIEKLGEPLPQAHKYFLDQRDKHFAHSVNSCEVNRSVILVPEPVPEEFIVEGVGFYNQRLTSIGEHDIEAMKKLCLELSEKVSAAIEEEREVVLEIARRIPRRELEGAQLIRAEISSVSQVGRSRRFGKAP